MSRRSMADAVRAVLVKRAFVPGDPSAGGMPPGGDPAAGGMPPGGDPAAGGMPPPGMDPAAGGMPPPGMDPSMMGGDPMAGMPPPGMDPSMMGGMPQTGMINMTADEFTKFIKQMMAAFGANTAPAQSQQPQADISAKLDTLIAVLQGKAAQPAAPAAVAGA